jgi:hypothetical protein
MEIINKLSDNVYRFKIIEDCGIPQEYIENKYGDQYITALASDDVMFYKKNICLFDITTKVPIITTVYDYNGIIPTYIFGEKYAEHNAKIIDDDYDYYTKMTDAEYYELNTYEFESYDDEYDDNNNITDISDDDETLLD